MDFIVWSNHALMCLDPDLSDLGFKKCRELAEQYKAPLYTGMDAKYVHYATTEQVCEKIKEIMLTCKEGTTPLIFLFSCLNNYEDVQKMWTICKAARFYSRPDVSWKDTFEAPAYVTFEEFLREKKANNPEGYTFNWLEHSAYRGLV